MEHPAVERRLAAILAADMVGYSRLMEADETGTLARLRAHRLELIDPAIAKNRGRMIKTTGDGMLVEFQSVAEAVECAVEIQRRMARRNGDVAPEREIQFRIGINLGDVISEDDDIFGDGVNVAARLQELAEPGGICVSGAIRDQVGEPPRRRLRGPRRAERQEHRPADPRLPGAPRRAEEAGARAGPGGARAGAARPGQALDRGAAVRQHERRSRAGVLRRRPDRGHHHRAVALSRPVRDLAQLGLRAQGQGGAGPGRRGGVRRPVRGRGQRAQGRQPGAHHRAADRRRDRPARLGRALRPRARGHLRDPGRGHRGDRRDAARAGRGGDPRPRQAQADRQHGGLRVRARRQGPAPSLDPRGQRRGAGPARAGDRARPEVCARPCLEGLRARPGLGLRLVRGSRRHLATASARSCRSRWRSTTTTATCTASSRR